MPSAISLPQPSQAAASFDAPVGGIHGSAHFAGWTCLALVESGVVSAAPLELGGADEAERRVTAAGIVEAIDVTGQRDDGFGSRLERGARSRPSMRWTFGVELARPSVRRPAVEG